MLVIVAALAVAGGGAAAGVLLSEDGGSSQSAPRHVYPKAVTDQFMAACMVHGKRNTCVCVLRAYQDTMPYTTYTAIARQGVRFNTRAIFQVFQERSTHCPQ